MREIKEILISAVLYMAIFGVTFFAWIILAAITGGI